MLHNLLASYSNSSSSSSSSGDLEGTINAILISYGSLIVVVLIFLVVRAIVNFFYSVLYSFYKKFSQGND